MTFIQKRLSFYVVLWVLASLVSACASPSPVETQPAATEVYTSRPYPGPIPTLLTGGTYPGQDIVPRGQADTLGGDLPEGALNIPALEAGLGGVRGKFVAETRDAQSFLVGDIYLAPVIYSQGKTSIPFVSLDPAKDPKAALRNRDQEFAFVNIKPGLYGLVIHSPVSDYLALDPNTGGSLRFEVKPDEMIDLGTIVIK
jgi:hypothetical protein